MFRKSICAVLVALVSVPAVAELRPGLGFSVTNESNAIMMPIDIDGRIRIEPTVAYLSTKRKSSGEFASGSSDRSATIGVGIFRLERGTDSLGIFYGARLSYHKSKLGQYAQFAEDATIERYFLEPTFGVEFNLAESLSLGGEVFVSYGETHGALDLETVTTGSRLTARFFF